MKIVREEIFGPVVVLTKFETEDEVVASANDSIYGLANAVFSENITRAHRVANALKSGTVWINCYNELHPQVPFGGYKQSGGFFGFSSFPVSFCHLSLLSLRYFGPRKCGKKRRGVISKHFQPARLCS